MNIKALIKVMRLRTLPLALVGIGYGTYCASFQTGVVKWFIAVPIFLTAAFLQIFSNIANDYGDYKNGADDHREDRATASGSISIKGMKVLLWVFGLLSFFTGLSLLAYVYFATGVLTGPLIFLGFGLLSLWAAYKYTAGDKPYGYAALGDISVFIFFGFLAVLGSIYIQNQLFHWTSLLPAIASGLLAVTVLNINNIRDIETDQRAGKITIANKLGLGKALLYQKTLYAIALASLAMFSKLVTFNDKQIILVAIFYFAFFVFQNHLSKVDSQKGYTKMLKFNVLIILLFSVLYWII